MTMHTDTSLTPSQEILGLVNSLHTHFMSRIKPIWLCDRIAQVYPKFLIITHQIIRASVPLMQTAQAKLHLQKNKSASNAALDHYLTMHIEEEQNHDIWALEDLEMLGFSRQAILSIVPSKWIASMVGAQYYWIEHYHPLSILGYIAVLEGNPSNVNDIEVAIQKTGYPAEAFKTALHHAKVDIEHKKELGKLLDNLNLTPDMKTLIRYSLMHTFEHTSQLFFDWERLGLDESCVALDAS